MTNYIVPPTTGAERMLDVDLSSSHGSAHKRRRPGAPPPAIPAGQEYYWTAEWRAGELETLAALEAGQGETFENVVDALRYLFSADD